MFLIEQYSSGKKVVLVVDEAQNLTMKVLEEIRLLSGIETHKEKVLRIILAGQPELKETLDSDGLKQLVQRVRLRFHLGPLDRRETREYVERRLSIAGRKKAGLFADDSFDVVYRFSGGIPRLINTLCDTALLCCFADDKHSVQAVDIISAAEELNWEEHENITGVYEQLRQSELDRIAVDKSHVTRIEIRENDEVIDVLTFPLGRVIVGRSLDNEIYINSKFASRHHAQLVSDESGCVIEDLNSTNGVFLGEKQVKKYRLRDGDIISLGIHTLTYCDLRAANEFDGGDTIAEDTVEDGAKAESGDQDAAVNEQ
jgi:hypothetical protein